MITVDEAIVGALVLGVLAYLIFISWYTVKQYISDDNEDY